MTDEDQLKDFSQQFQIYGQFLRAEWLNIGHINETCIATYDQGGTRVRYIHQKLNRRVFKDPAGLMNNLVRVTAHIRENWRRATFAI